MSLEVFGVPLKLNQHFSMAPNVFNVIFNNISAQMLPLNEIPIPIEKLHCIVNTISQRMHKKLIRNFERSNQTHAKKPEPLTPTEVSYKKLSVYQ